MEPRISIVTLGVSDLKRSVGFYQTLGFRSSPASNDGVAFLHAGGVVLALYPRTLLAEDAHLPAGTPAPFGGFTLAHNVAEREQVDRVLAEAEAAGARVLKPAKDVFWGGRSGYFADPDGHPWEVAWNPHFPLGIDGTLELP
jgi:catechol 2,3-dioxygenase-like lactoylglutathione lyase family enzyme